MARQKEPVDLILAKGNKAHLTKKEIQKRRENEIDISQIKNVECPKELKTNEEQAMFWHYADLLIKINIFTELDVGILVQYIKAYFLYLDFTESVDNLKNTDEIGLLKDFMTLQDKAFKQCHMCARELGLSISSRCKLQVPKEEEKEEDYSAYFS